LLLLGGGLVNVSRITHRALSQSPGSGLRPLLLWLTFTPLAPPAAGRSHYCNHGKTSLHSGNKASCFEKFQRFRGSKGRRKCGSPFGRSRLLIKPRWWCIRLTILQSIFLLFLWTWREHGPFSYRCLFLGTNPLGGAWPRGLQFFPVDGINRPSVVEGRVLGTQDYQRFFNGINWTAFFNSHPDPPDALAVQIPKELDLQWGMVRQMSQILPPKLWWDHIGKCPTLGCRAMVRWGVHTCKRPFSIHNPFCTYLQHPSSAIYIAAVKRSSQFTTCQGHFGHDGASEKESTCIPYVITCT
jgi:hypothetical protein